MATKMCPKDVKMMFRGVQNQFKMMLTYWCTGGADCSQRISMFVYHSTTRRELHWSTTRHLSVELCLELCCNPSLLSVSPIPPTCPVWKQSSLSAQSLVRKILDGPCDSFLDKYSSKIHRWQCKTLVALRNAPENQPAASSHAQYDLLNCICISVAQYVMQMFLNYSSTASQTPMVHVSVVLYSLSGMSGHDPGSC